MNVYLWKKFLSWSCKNKELITTKKEEELNIIFNSIPNFSQQLLSFFLNLLTIFLNVFWEVFSLFFLIRSRHLSQLILLIITFILTNFFCLVFFNFLIRKIRKRNRERKKEYQKQEKDQIKHFLENIDREKPNESLGKIHSLLNNNSQKLDFSFFISTFSHLPNLIIPGINILFLFLVYNFWLGHGENIDWNLYFVAHSCQAILLQVGKIFHLFFSSYLQKNYQIIENFYF